MRLSIWVVKNRRPATLSRGSLGKLTTRLYRQKTIKSYDSLVNKENPTPKMKP